MPDASGAVMIDGKMQDDATWKQAKVLVDLARLVAAKTRKWQPGTSYERPDGKNSNKFKNLALQQMPWVTGWVTIAPSPATRRGSRLGVSSTHTRRRSYA
jgi:hypothetical protein